MPRICIYPRVDGMGGVGHAEDFEGVAADYMKLVARLRETSREIAAIYAERSGKDEDYWLGKMAVETRFTDRPAVAEGLADEVGPTYDAANFAVAANLDWSGYKEAADIKAELLEAVEPGDEEPPAEPEPDRIAQLIARVEALEAAVLLPKRNGSPPVDAARRELEEALARVQL